MLEEIYQTYGIHNMIECVMNEQFDPSREDYKELLVPIPIGTRWIEGCDHGFPLEGRQMSG